MADRSKAPIEFSENLTGSLHRTSLRLINTPRSVVTLVGVLLALFIGLVVFLVLVPWIQTVSGSGTVTSFAPESRPQTINAMITGRIVDWYIKEGARVRKGDTLAILQDINVNFFDNDLAGRLTKLRDKTLEAQESAISVSIQRRKQAEQRLEQARARYDNIIVELTTARIRFNRADELFKDDLVSRREVETATLALQKAMADSISGMASIQAAIQDVDAFRNEEERVISQAQVVIQDAEVRLANATGRIGARIVTAPLDGTVVRIARAGKGQTVKEGDELVVIVPQTDDQAAEIYVSSLDAALIEPGRLVSLQFSGFPAFQFSGWDNVNVGIFHGRVKVIDAVDDGSGRFRVLVVPDTTRTPWPTNRFLRQGTEVSGWVLLNEVPIGYELWRQLMGFPPQFPVAEGKVKDKPKDESSDKGGKK